MTPELLKLVADAIGDLLEDDAEIDTHAVERIFARHRLEVVKADESDEEVTAKAFMHGARYVVDAAEAEKVRMRPGRESTVDAISIDALEGIYEGLRE